MTNDKSLDQIAFDAANITGILCKEKIENRIPRFRGQFMVLSMNQFFKWLKRNAIKINSAHLPSKTIFSPSITKPKKRRSKGIDITPEVFAKIIEMNGKEVLTVSVDQFFNWLNKNAIKILIIDPPWEKDSWPPDGEPRLGSDYICAEVLSEVIEMKEKGFRIDEIALGLSDLGVCTNDPERPYWTARMVGPILEEAFQFESGRPHRPGFKVDPEVVHDIADLVARGHTEEKIAKILNKRGEPRHDLLGPNRLWHGPTIKYILKRHLLSAKNIESLLQFRKQNSPYGPIENYVYNPLTRSLGLEVRGKIVSKSVAVNNIQPEPAE